MINNTLGLEQTKMLKHMLSSEIDNPFLKSEEWVFGRVNIERIVDCGYYFNDEKDMLNSLRDSYITYRDLNALNSLTKKTWE